MIQSPVICPALPTSSFATWPDIEGVFASIPHCELGQSWLPKLETDFLPASVRFGWHGQTLYLYAIFQDIDIYSAATELNQPMWLLGDVFELFIKPPRGENYFELHVTPDNHRLQLRFPDARAIESETDWTEFQRVEPLFQSRTEVDVAQQRWRVFMALEMPVLLEGHDFDPSEEWKFSVSRYDYTRGNAQPVLSSTSPHPVAGFHRQQEWRNLIFAK